MSTSLLLFWLVVSFMQLSLSIRPYRLRVEYMDNPYGIDVVNPRFFWAVDTEGVRGGDQAAYQIKIYNISSKGTKTLLTDSGKIISNSSSQIIVKGFSVTSNTDYTWNVIVYNSSNAASTNNPDGYFSGGLLDNTDWMEAAWIGIPNYKAKGNAYQIRNSNITLHSAFDRIKCYITMPGYYKAWINNQLVDDHLLGYFTTFEKRVYYDSFDCTNLFKQGENVFGIWLGNGWYSQPSINIGPPMFKLLVRVEYNDNTIEYIKSNNNDYYQHPGPIRMNDIYDGEWYDANYETPGWLDINYNYITNGWTKASIITNVTVGKLLSSAIMPKSRKTETYTALSVTEPSPGIFVFDMGQNIAGLSRITIPGNNKKGANVTLIHSEELDENGFVVEMYSKSPMIGVYTLRGDGQEEIYEGSFTYYGFQYVQVEGYPTNVVTQNCMQSYFIHTDFDTNGGSIIFGPSNVNNNNNEFNAYLLNQIQHMTRYSSLSNYINIPTDCPQRERRGWLGDAQLSALVTIHNFDMAASYYKFLYDIQDVQELLYDTNKGALPDCAPWYHHGHNPGDPSWTVAYTFITYWMWKYYGDERVITEHYDSIKSQLEFLESELDTKTGLLPLNTNIHGDWCAVIPNTGNCKHISGLISTYDWAKECLYFSKLANVIGNENDSTAYNNKYEAAKKAIYTNYWNESTHSFVDNAGTATPTTLNALALDLGVLSSDQSADIQSAAKAIADYQKDHDYHLNAGIIGVKYVYPELCKNGYCDVALRVNLQTTMPSYGFWYEQKATTLWENWESTQYTAHGSKNHIMFGAQGGWYYQYLAGIRQSDESMNWNEVIIDPYTNATLFNVSIISASINTYKGLLSSSWTTDVNSNHNHLCAANIPEKQNVTLNCENGSKINKIVFASYGTPSGQCGSLKVNQSCNNNNSMEVVSNLCLHQNSCIIGVNNNEFGYDPCKDVHKHLDVQVQCENEMNIYLQINVTIPSGSLGNVYLRRNAMMTQNGNPPIEKWIVQENSINIWQDMKFSNADKGVVNGVSIGDDTLMFTTKSGTYSFLLAASL